MFEKTAVRDGQGRIVGFNTTNTTTGTTTVQDNTGKTLGRASDQGTRDASGNLVYRGNHPDLLRKK